MCPGRWVSVRCLFLLRCYRCIPIGHTGGSSPWQFWSCAGVFGSGCTLYSERRLPLTIRDIATLLIALNAKVLVVNSAASTAAKPFIKDRPLVFVAGDDPVTNGLVSSLHRPGGNITGVSFLDVPVASKRLGLLLKLLPPTAKIAAMLDSKFSSAAEELRGLQTAMHAVHRPLVVLKAASEAEISAAFNEMSRQSVAGLFVGAGPTLNVLRRKIIALAALHAIPAAYSTRERGRGRASQL